MSSPDLDRRLGIWIDDGGFVSLLSMGERRGIGVFGRGTQAMAVSPPRLQDGEWILVGDFVSLQTKGEMDR
ncbi:unnamed protein product [Linum trigynum]|uniref:Uncharacterized protein n=1 Tax=Linum trigynum TaxID=586398 RepID=A0AAV2FMZ0_9ROSI